ncbi:hypothetical protein CEP51_006053 [Fusarium floridanum]|uniref:C2H2-type domain-containing protein n=1 Tax=Fusarium floridanum TaxID=1325733 RepID=A0A428RU81_9HYPO|nr:hypothetical protein CEP51_006053 [Fusarium floridanum]
MARRILSCRGNGSPGQQQQQPRAPKDEPDNNNNNQPASAIYHIPYRPVSDPPHGSSLPSPLANSAGIKRDRSGQPRTPTQNQRFQSSDWSSSEDELDSSSSSSDSDSDDSSCVEGKHDWRDAVPAYVLPQNHRFQDIRPELVKSILDSLERWMKTTRYVSPPDDRLPPRKRLRTSHWQEGEDSDDGFVVVDPPAGYFHLACPLYVANPAKYQDCLLHHDLQSNEDVIRHIWRNHMKPPYCPICSKTFESISSRDSHILERKCELRDLQPIDGINYYQKSKLKRRDRVYHGEAKRWRRIYATVFPNSDRSASPYLDKGCGKAVSMARDYWAAKGRRSVARFLESRQLLGNDYEDEEDAQDALCKLVLEDVLREIVRRYGRS